MNYFEKENNVYFAKMRDDAIIPNKEEENAGYDIYASFDEDFIKIESCSTKLIPTGIAWACSPKFYMQIEERSSTGSKGIKRSAGIIDSGYRGEIKIAITNSNKNNLYISNLSEDDLRKKYGKEIEENALVYYTKKAIAQGIIHRVESMDIKEISLEELLKIDSNRKDKGFGSTNKI